jgi:very-short-patch-repair endonuclease
MHKQRQHRGGYEFSGLVQFARELRKSQTCAQALLWELLRDRRFLGSNSGDNIKLVIMLLISFVEKHA